MNINFEARLKAGIKYDKDVEAYVTYAPALRLYSQGETVIQAKSALKDAIQSFLIVAYSNGVLEKCLKNVGFSIITDPRSTLCENGEYISFEEEEILEEKKNSRIFLRFQPFFLCL
ncbi:hypothetical protein ES705_50285 [subsurface metagenome]